MLNRVILYWFTALAIAVPVSIAATSLLYFPLLSLYVLLGAWTFQRWPPQWGLLEKAFLIFWLVSLLSAVCGIDPWHSRVRLGKDLYFFISVLLMAYLLQEDHTTRLTKVFMISAVATAAFGILQKMIGVNELLNDATGTLWSIPHWLAHAPRSIQAHLTMMNGRVVGTRAHPLTYAEGLLFPLGYALSYLASRRADWWKWAIAQYLILLALVVSQSRGPWIAAVMMVVAICLLHRKAIFYKRLALIYMPIALCFLASASLRARVMSITNSNYEPNAERLEMWRAGMKMLHTHPLLGIGPGSVPLASPAYQSPERKLGGAWGHLHNTYVNVITERGILGIVTFAGFIGVLIYELWYGYKRSLHLEEEDSKMILLTALLGLLGWLVAGFTETVYHDSNVLMVFYFVIGLAMATSRRLRKDLQRV